MMKGEMSSEWIKDSKVHGAEVTGAGRLGSDDVLPNAVQLTTFHSSCHSLGRRDIGMTRIQQAALKHSLIAPGMSTSASSSRMRRDDIGDAVDIEANDRAVALLDLSISLIDQALDILNRHLKEDKQLTHASKLMPGGSVGKHFRHVSPSLA